MKSMFTAPAHAATKAPDRAVHSTAGMFSNRRQRRLDHPVDDVSTPWRNETMTEAIHRAMTRLTSTLRVSAPWLFARELISQPASVGAVWPSSSQLAKGMAACVPSEGKGLVIELGGGTGAVTQALLEHGIAPERLLVVERSPAFVQHLRARFPSIKVVEGDATELADLLEPGTEVDAIVSSLPLRSLPRGDAAAIVAQWRALLAPGGTVVQFTYDLRNTAHRPPPGFLKRASDIVWANLPPARVLALECCTADPGF
jgi:phospholipid N-methyltransferase